MLLLLLSDSPRRGGDRSEAHPCSPFVSLLASLGGRRRMEWSIKMPQLFIENSLLCDGRHCKSGDLDLMCFSGGCSRGTRFVSLFVQEINQEMDDGAPNLCAHCPTRVLRTHLYLARRPCRKRHNSPRGVAGHTGVLAVGEAV
jgi:hypothetical protein